MKNQSTDKILFAILTTILTTTVSCVTSAPVVESQVDQEKSTASTEFEWLLDTRPLGNTLVFVGAGPRHSNRDIEKLTALKDAAMQAGVFSGFWGSRQDFIASSVHGTSLSERTRADYDGNAEDAAFEQLELLGEWVTEEGTWGKYQLERNDIPSMSWQPEYMDGRPTWLHRPPEINGWLVAVGLGNHQSTLAKSIRKADEAALAEVVQRLYGENRTVNIDKTLSSQTWSQTDSASASYAKGFGIVRGFLVIARWYDDSGAWSLAACPLGWNGG